MFSRTGGVLLVVLVTFAIISTSAYPDCADCGVCQAHYKPVCGSDGITYHNACQLGCQKQCRTAGLKVVHDGECGVAVG